MCSNKDKIQAMTIRSKQIKSTYTRIGKIFEKQVEKFKYLGTMISQNARLDDEKYRKDQLHLKGYSKIQQYISVNSKNKQNLKYSENCLST